MAKTNRTDNATLKGRSTPAAKSRSRAPAAKIQSPARPTGEPVRTGWATDLVFDVREPKLAVSLRLDADVLRFFRGFGAGYQTRNQRGPEGVHAGKGHARNCAACRSWRTGRAWLNQQR